jgi:hypothetical protein
VEQSVYKQIFLLSIIVLLPLGNAYLIGSGISIASDIDMFYLDDGITQHLAKYGQYMPLIDLGFAVGEMCQLFREQPSLKAEFIKNIRAQRKQGMSMNNASFWEIEDRFFRSQLRHNKAVSKEYAKEIESIEREFPILSHSSPQTNDQIRKVIEEASEAYGISEPSTAAFDMLVLDGERVILIVQDSRELTIKYRRWLSELRETGIYSPWTHGGILERKRAYVLEKYDKFSNELMRDTLNSIRITAVRHIE